MNRTPLEEFKAQLDGWCSLNQFRPVAGIWIDDVAPYKVPSQVPVVLCIEEHELFSILNGFADDPNMKLYNEFESLMQKCGVWWEQQDSCIVWIFEEGAFDEVNDG